MKMILIVNILYNALNNVRPFTIGATLVLEPKDDFINRTRWQ